MKNLMKKFKTLFIIMVGLPVILMLILVWGGKKITNDINNSNSYVGKQVVLKNDTLLILDYSILRDTYILEDKEIDADLVKNNIKFKVIN